MPKRSILAPPEACSSQMFARVRAHDWSIEAPPTSSLRADGLGRWQAARLDGQLHRRLLDGRVVVYRSPRGSPEDVPSAEQIHRRVAALAAELRARASEAGAQLTLGGDTPTREALTDALERCEGWTVERLEAERERFHAAYPEPVEILPPDRYRDVVVLPATGCPNAQCTFCAFYHGRSFQPLGPRALQAHIEAVRDLLGPALPLRTGLFLGSASALSLSQARLRHILELARETLGIGPRGAGAFWDADHAPRRDAVQWAELAELSLGAVYLGLETGLAELRERVGKSGAIEPLIEAVKLAREAVDPAHLRIGVIVMAGLGGAAPAEAHRRATVEVVGRLALDRGDIVYVSPLAGSLPAESLAAEAALIKHELRERTAARVVPYAMQQFRYFA